MDNAGLLIASLTIASGNCFANGNETGGAIFASLAVLSIVFFVWLEKD